eukprot:TRINITY_DN24689_c0_g2_i5.p1 TRINITY_DN24689_c0_g2~~TRINITY_DN24689_c0_g2_i5.p1  ORF type:complete len:111 (-),score=5.86 TRINITY_DN24689_c0_g2_i5:544-876(-)
MQKKNSVGWEWLDSVGWEWLDRQPLYKKLYILDNPQTGTALFSVFMGCRHGHLKQDLLKKIISKILPEFESFLRIQKFSRSLCPCKVQNSLSLFRAIVVCLFSYTQGENL